MKYEECRRRWPVMRYEAYRYEMIDEGVLRLEFRFSLDKDHVFTPSSVINCKGWSFISYIEELDPIVFNIGMVELISYWKCVCAPTVVVECGGLTESQVAFWKKLYWHGLGEFFYTNGIEATEEDFMHIEFTSGTSTELVGYNWLGPTPRHYIVPIGGGKDSVVTLELLKRANCYITPLIINPRGATIECVRAAGLSMEGAFVIQRTIDPLLLEMNRQGFLNGHTPFSAMLAFYSLLVAHWVGIGNVALSNEGSANESTVIGTTVNHQYSKSLEFENDFRRYTQDMGVNYFSFLRPLSELQIAMLFSRMEQYHDVFRSCNVGSKTDVWCGHCAKCLFAYIILAPFIEPSRLDAIFGKPMLDDVSLRHEFEQLTGRAATKPFECVGTIDEVNTALAMAISRWYGDRRPALLQGYEPGEPTVPLNRISHKSNLNHKERRILRRAIREFGIRC